MFAVVKNVRSWRSLGEGMGYSSTLLDSMQRWYDSDEGRLKVMVARFLRDDVPFNDPSWRAVILCLYRANEFQLAKQIRSYAEPVQGTVI